VVCAVFTGTCQNELQLLPQCGTNVNEEIFAGLSLNNGYVIFGTGGGFHVTCASGILADTISLLHFSPGWVFKKGLAKFATAWKKPSSLIMVYGYSCSVAENTGGTVKGFGNTILRRSLLNVF